MKINLKNLIIFVVILLTLSFVISYFGIKGWIPWEIAYNDVGGWNKKAFEPGMPFIDKVVEYPVIIGLVMDLAANFNLEFYMIIHFLIFTLCSIVTTIYLYKLSEKIGSPKKYLFLFWGIAPSLLWFGFYNWDIIVVMFSVLGLYYFLEKRDILASIFIGLGVATKMYPLLILLPVVFHRRFKDWFKIGFTFLGTVVLVNIFFMISNFATWFFAYRFNGIREPNIDSIWGLAYNNLGISVDAINWITLALFGVLYLYFNVKFVKKGFLFNSFVSILLFLIINKVFSPQFTLWLLPFFALFGVRLLWFYILEISNLLVLFFTVPHIFSGLTFSTMLVFSGVFVVLRHIMLITILVATLKKRKV